MAIGFAQLQFSKNADHVFDFVKYFESVKFLEKDKESLYEAISADGTYVMLSYADITEEFNIGGSVTIKLRKENSTGINCTIKKGKSIIIEEYSFDELEKSETEKFIFELKKRFRKYLGGNSEALVIDKKGYSEDIIDWNTFFISHEEKRIDYTPLIIGARKTFFKLVNHYYRVDQVEDLGNFQIATWLD